MFLKKLSFLIGLTLVLNVTAFSQNDSLAYSILQKTFTKYNSLDTISFSCEFTHQELNKAGSWDTLYYKSNSFTAVQSATKQWHPAIYFSRDKNNITEFYRFRDALIRSKWAAKNHKIALHKSCGKTPFYVIEYWDVPFSLTAGNRDSLVRQTIYIDTLSYLIESVQSVVSFSETQIGLFSFIMDSIDTHEKIIIPEVFQLNNGMLKPGEIAPPFALKNTINETISLSDYRGKLILLDFWYAACKPCIKASVGLENLHQKYAKRGLVVLGMNTMDSAAKIKRHNKKHKVSYPSVMCTRAMKTTYKVRSFPSFYLIDENGKIVFSSSGYYIGLDKDLEMAVLQAFSNR
ncbi:MAG: TlpA family protein disulfide reductase [Bacteroidales bacterium]|nr:TlpA family protein disulfide reductase [Bacteroidales bacterium]